MNSEPFIHANIAETDTILNGVIQQFLDGPFYSGETITVSQWRVANYQKLRRWLFQTRDDDHRDALGKINDPDQDPVIIAEGQAALTEYYTWRKRDVKERFPKE